MSVRKILREHLCDLNVFRSYLLGIFGRHLTELVRVRHQPGRAVAVAHVDGTPSGAASAPQGQVLTRGDASARHDAAEANDAFRVVGTRV